MAAGNKQKPIPIYTTRGDWAALLVFPYLFSTVGEWIGFVTKVREVYDTDGVYVGWITNEPRILRKRILEDELKRTELPPFPSKIRPPATVPLPPMMAELPFEIIDVFEEEPDRLHTTDTGEFKEDMD
jgi:hypothetical protein